MSQNVHIVQDDRYKHLIGRDVLVPIQGRRIPVIADAYVDREFGTGALKITPAHDFNDFEIGRTHGLENHTVRHRLLGWTKIRHPLDQNVKRPGHWAGRLHDQ